MKKYILMLMAAAFVFAGCEKKEKLTPSLIETDLLFGQLDLSNPTVKSFYEDCGVYILTEFDAARDMQYNLDSFWKNLELTKLENAADKARAFEFLHESFLVYFTDKDFIKKNFPRKILLTGEVFLNVTTGNEFCPVTEESDWRVGQYARNSLHSMYSKGAFAFSMKLETIYYNEANYDNYVRDNMYIFLADLFERNNLYDEFGPELYLPAMSLYYGRRFSGEATINNNYTTGVWVEEGRDPNVQLTGKDWYWEKGFVSTAWVNPVLTGTNEGMIRLRDGQSVDAYSFPDKKREVRTLINQMLGVGREVWDSYPDIVKDRFRVLVEKFDEWGIDIRSFNPTMQYAFPR